LLAVTPAEVVGARGYDPFCANGVLAAINQLADFSHSKTLSDLVTAGKWKGELLLTLGKVAPPRYANFIGRYKDDADASVRQAVAVALGTTDNEAVSVPVLIQLLARGDRPEDFAVKWDASSALIALTRRRPTDGVPRRLHALLGEPSAMTVVLAARALAAAADARGLLKLRDLTTHGDPQVRQEAVLALAETSDTGSAEAVRRRLKDENLAVRACAVYALARIEGPAAVSTLRAAVEESLDRERELAQRKERGEDADLLDAKYGLGAFDLRETLQEAMTVTQTPRQRR
jgi:HEAT repeat protein